MHYIVISHYAFDSMVWITWNVFYTSIDVVSNQRWILHDGTSDHLKLTLNNSSGGFTVPNPLGDEKWIVEQVVDLWFLGEDTNRQLGFVKKSRNKPRIFIWVSWVTQDFCVHSQNQARISIVYLEAYRGPTGATALGSASASRSMSL